MRIGYSLRYNLEDISSGTLQRPFSFYVVMKIIGILKSTSIVKIYLYDMISKRCRQGRYIVYRKFIDASCWKRLSSSWKSVLKIGSHTYDIIGCLVYSTESKISKHCRWNNGRYSWECKLQRIGGKIFCNLERTRKNRPVSISILQTVYFPISATRYKEGIPGEIQTRRFSDTVFSSEKLRYTTRRYIIG